MLKRLLCLDNKLDGEEFALPAQYIHHVGALACAHDARHVGLMRLVQNRSRASSLIVSNTISTSRVCNYMCRSVYS